MDKKKSSNLLSELREKAGLTQAAFLTALTYSIRQNEDTLKRLGADTKIREDEELVAFRVFLHNAAKRCIKK